MKEADGHADPDDDAGGRDAGDEPAGPGEVAEAAADVAAVGRTDGAAA